MGLWSVWVGARVKGKGERGVWSIAERMVWNEMMSDRIMKRGLLVSCLSIMSNDRHPRVHRHFSNYAASCCNAVSGHQLTTTKTDPYEFMLGYLNFQTF